MFKKVNKSEELLTCDAFYELAKSVCYSFVTSGVGRGKTLGELEDIGVVLV